MAQGRIADTGFKLEYADVNVSPIGPLILAFFAVAIMTQGLVYLLRPDMTGRSMQISEAKLRRIGLIIMLGGALIFYIAFSWWVGPADTPRSR